MSLTKTVQSFAHDAVHAAGELASDVQVHASDLGARVAEMGVDAASSVASAAGDLVAAIGTKLPTSSKRRRSRWPLVALGAVGAGGVAFAVLRRRRAGIEITGHEGIAVPAAGASGGGESARATDEADSAGQDPKATRATNGRTPASAT